MPRNDGFDWNEDECVVVREQAATAVYFNARDGLVIRQQQAWDEEMDTIVILQPDQAEAVARQILQLLAWKKGRRAAENLAQGGSPDDFRGQDANPNAVRQRRYRERRRNSVMVAPVTRDVTGNAEELDLELGTK